MSTPDQLNDNENIIGFYMMKA